jgi:alkylresorcinol/alkylpyrone synthase
MPQALAREKARAVFGERGDLYRRMEPVFANTGIETRHLAMPIEWYLTPRDFEEKTRCYTEVATALAIEAGSAALAEAGLAAEAIDAIVTVSSTGVLTPSLDARLINELPFRHDTIRLPIFGLGCAGGVLGLTRAAQIARSRPGMRCLVIVVELCSLAGRHDKMTKSNIVATALFGDGAAAAVIESDGEDGGGGLGTLEAGGEHCWPGTLGVMGWAIDNQGFDVIFQRSIPEIIVKDYPAALAAFLERSGLDRDAVARPCCHPGGAKVIAALEEVFGIAPGGLDAEREVLRRYGNMSAPTVLFVLDRLLRAKVGGPVLMSALGPGFTAAFQMMRLTP